MSTSTIYLAGGCFWGVQEYFSRIPGVTQTKTGYANGSTANPSYEDVCYRGTGHAETIQVQYDPSLLGMETLLDHYFSIIDPFVLNRQGPDRGTQYRTGVYYETEEDLPLLEELFQKEQAKHDRKILVELLPLTHFYPAEEQHQDYLKKNPKGYCHVDLSGAKAHM
ncbi:MAG: peptide-methionine (S)-S-oxide reductase MsrA [Treponema sp.]|nr:peptide-methionine (S)-S-oxide reductase MsrA [Treponema sp.]